MKKVLLIGMYNSKSVSLAPHILKAYVEQLDISKKFEISTEEFNTFSANLTEEVILKINSLKPDIVGFSTYIWNINEILKIIKYLKTIIIIGGPQVTGIEKELLYQNPNIDFIVTGEGEIVFKELLEYFENKRNLKDVNGITTRSIKTTREDYVCLDDAKLSYKEIFDKYPNLEWISIETSRGCRFNCAFCVWNKFSKKMRYVSLEKVKKDLYTILKQKNIKYIYFCDSSILFDKQRAKKILQFLIDNKCEKILKFEFDYIDIDNEIIDLLNELPNQEFNIGIQTINQSALKIMKKSFAKNIFENRLNNLTQKLNNSRIGIDVIYGLPNDNLEGYKKTLNYIISLNNIEKILTNVLLILPGSDFFYNVEKYGIKTDNYVVTETASFIREDMKLAKKYSFYVFVVYLNYKLKECIKDYANKVNQTYINMIITFFDSLSENIFEEKFPHLLSSDKKDLESRDYAIANVIKRYKEIINAFKIFSEHKYDEKLEDYERSFSSYYKRYEEIYT